SQLYCSSTHPLYQHPDSTPVELSGWDAVLPAYAQTPEIKALHEPLKAAASATDREGIAFLILTGRYIGYLPTHYAQRRVRDEAMRAIDPLANRYITHYGAITRKGAPPNLVLESYLGELDRGVKIAIRWGSSAPGRVTASVHEPAQDIQRRTRCGGAQKTRMLIVSS